MSNYDNTNKGAMWGNKEKKSDTHPDFKGSINIEGVEYWLSGWKRDPTGNPNAPAVKFSYTAKEAVHNAGMAQAQQAQDPQQQAPAGNYDNFDDDSIPF
jgi:hypothetical protein